MTTPGIYWCNNSSTNLPVASSGGGLVVLAQSSSSVVQLFVQGNATSSLYTRRGLSGTWSSWVEK